MSLIRNPLCAFALALVAAGPRAGLAQTVDPNLWVTNGDVYAVASHEGTVYIGGTFSRVGPVTGPAAPIDATSGALPASFPKVSGQLFVVIPDGGGGWYLGGAFSSVGGQPRNNIAHVASDLTVSSWNPNANSTVRGLAVRGTTVYAGGHFSEIGGQPRNFLAALDATSGSATSWNPAPDAPVFTLLVYTYFVMCPEGLCPVTNVYVAGDFSMIGGQFRNFLAAIDPTSGLATSWNPNPSGRVFAIRATGSTPQGLRVYVCGGFTVIGGQVRNRIAQLNASGTATTWNPNANNVVQDLVVSGSTVYAGGQFTNIGGQPRNYIAALDGAGTATGWNPNANANVLSLALGGSTVYLGGDFTSIGGQSRTFIAALDAASGAPTSWDPSANNTVRTVAVSGSTVYAGGTFSSIGGVVRHNIAALDAETGAVTAWNPDADDAVYALALVTSGEWVLNVYAGGSFAHIGGQVRIRLAALNPVTGGATAWSPLVGGTVQCIALNGSSVIAGGFLTVEAFDATTAAETWQRVTNSGDVRALAVSGSELYVGGDFTQIDGFARNHIAKIWLNGALVLGWNPNANDVVRCLAVSGSTVYAGGDFTSIGGQVRNRAAALDATSGAAMSWHPNANGSVSTLVLAGSTMYVGGSFTSISAIPRSRIAALGVASAIPTAWTADADGAVHTLAVNGPTVYAGGAFASIGGETQRGFAAIESPVTCSGSALTSPAGDSPRAIVGADLNNDGIRDLVVCNVAEATILRGGGFGGLGNGTFSIAQTLPLGAKPMQAIAADFDSDGFQDVAVSHTSTTGAVSVFLNNAGTLQYSSTIPVLGRADGLACADLDLDGILDLVVCLVDSASIQYRGGIQVLRGGGQGGVWDGTFVSALKIGTTRIAANHVVVHDFNQDGIPDIAFTGIGGGVLHFTAPLSPGCKETGFLGELLATGDFGEDGRQDIASSAQQRIQVGLKNNATTPCSATWFTTADPESLTSLPGTPRDMVALDHDLDGILDLAFTVGATVQLSRGRGTAGVGDGTFDPPILRANLDAWRIAVGDFATNGSPDLAISMRLCGSVTVVPQTATPILPIDLTLVAPNGGEIWPQGSAAPQIASTQQITWTKGAGVQGVDVEITRDDGASWQPIATNAPGTTLTWIVTPPSTASARVRVSDAAVAQRSDASDGAFQIPGGPTDASPGDRLPRVAAFSLRDRNPVRSVARFSMVVPATNEVHVEVFDVRGRLVRTLVDATLEPGSHDVDWDRRDAHGRLAPRGVYFVRARIGSFGTQRKVVALW